MKKKASLNIDGHTCWFCSACKYWKPEGDYYADKNRPNGLHSACKTCHNKCSVRTRDPIRARQQDRESKRRMRKSDPARFTRRYREDSAKREKNTPQIMARRKLYNAVRSGKIEVPLRCEDEDCKRMIRLTAHHPDYTKPLEVHWLCYECHGRRHWKH